MVNVLGVNEKYDIGIISNAINWRRVKRNLVKLLNGAILLALAVFVVLHLRRSRFLMLDMPSRLGSSNENTLKSQAEVKTSNRPRQVKIKVPWRYQLEDDGFVFPKMNRLEKFIAYKPSPISWTKQLLQFENALIFAYLMERTLLVPPLIQRTFFDSNSSLDTGKYFPISKIIDFNMLSKVVPMKEVMMKQIEELRNTSSVYSICHDHRLGFWVDFIPAVEDIQLWRLLKAQKFTAFPVSLSGHEVDLMCPGTLQYGNRWGPPMKVKPIIRSIMTELYEREEDLVYFEGDTLSTKDLRFFDKTRTKTIQQILIFHVQFSKRINKLLLKLMRHLGNNYNAILAGPLFGNNSIEVGLKARLHVEGFRGLSSTIFVSCRQEDEKKFLFLKELGYELIFESQLDIKAGKSNGILHDIHKMCITLLCAYATKLIPVAASEDEFYVEHLRLQNVTMKDGLVIDNINVRWAKHTQLPRKDERVILERKNLTDALIKKDTAKNTTEVLNQKRVDISDNVKNHTNGSLLYLPKVSGIMQNKTTTKNSSPIKKPKSKLDLMVCAFCLYIKRITAEHGCPTLISWCH